MEKDLLFEKFYLLLQFIEDDKYINNIISDLFDYLSEKDTLNILSYLIDDMVDQYDLNNIINN